MEQLGAKRGFQVIAKFELKFGFGLKFYLGLELELSFGLSVSTPNTSELKKINASYRYSFASSLLMPIFQYKKHRGQVILKFMSIT